MPISAWRWRATCSRALREDLKILVMSATLDGARVAALLGDAPVIESEGRAFAVETRYLGRDPRARIESQVADAVQRALRADTGSLLVFLPGAAEIRRTETLLKERVDGPERRYRRALWRARRARAGPRHFAGAGRAAQGGAGDLDRGNLAHHRGRARRHRQRAVAGAALRAGCRPDAAGNRAGVARRRRPAARPRRPHRAGRLLPAVGRAADRFAGALYAAGNPRRPTCRPSCSIWRNGAPAIRPSSRSSIRRRRPRSARPRRCSPSSAPSTRRPHHRGGPHACAPCRCRRGSRAWWSMRRREGAGALAAANRRRAHRARARRRRSRSAPPARSVPPRPLAPRRGCARDGEAVG